MSSEIITGLVVVILDAVVDTFGIGHTRGASKVKTKADQQHAEENVAATVATAKRRAEVVKGASDIQGDVERMGDGDVDRELHEKFTRPGSHWYGLQLGADHLPG